MIPLSINCWPSENDSGGVDVNIEYELEKEDMELNQVLIQIPLPPGTGAPVVHECEGEKDAILSRLGQRLYQARPKLSLIS